MFWPIVGASAVAVGLIQLGALSVWVAVLKAMLAVLLAAVLVLGVAFVWRRHRSTGGNSGG